jgi:glycosyltransferase involved in cell wall biosynthesis
MVEAMARGTPVIAVRGGAGEEVLLYGQTGYICDPLDEMAEAVARVGRIDRATCRRHVKRHFSPAKMIARYEAVYRGLLAELPCPKALHSSASTLRAVD